MKKRIFAIAVIMICMAVAGYGTLAYFTDEAVAHNVITTGGVGVEIYETTAQGGLFQNVSGVMPGKSVSKVVQVKNTGASDEWVRIKVDVRLAPENLPLTIQDKQGAQVDVIKLDFDSTNWTKGADGCYYYNSPVGVGGITEPLFKNVTFAPEMGNEYQNCHVMINVIAQSVQVKNNGTTVLEAAGWPAIPAD